MEDEVEEAIKVIQNYMEVHKLKSHVFQAPVFWIELNNYIKLMRERKEG